MYFFGKREVGRGRSRKKRWKRKKTGRSKIKKKKEEEEEAKKRRNNEMERQMRRWMGPGNLPRILQSDNKQIK